MEPLSYTAALPNTRVHYNFNFFFLMRISKYSTRAPHTYTKNTKSKIQLAIPPRMPVSVLNLYPCVYLLSVGDFCCCCSVRWMVSFNKCYPVANIGSFVVSVLTKVCRALSFKTQTVGSCQCSQFKSLRRPPKSKDRHN